LESEKGLEIFMQRPFFVPIIKLFSVSATIYRGPSPFPFESLRLRGKLQSMSNHRLLRIHAIFLPMMLWAVGVTGADRKQAAEKAREIEDNLIAPCCWTQPVSQHYSEVSEQIRQEVRAMVEAGKSRDEIFDYYVAKYGERILAAPRAKGFNALAYILPWAALALGAGLLIVLLRKVRSPAPARIPDPLPPASDSRYNAIIEKELRELDE
jgi:cytochrome c-type biogenesis protein CcmH